MSVRVTIRPTDLDPAGASLRYVVDLRTAEPGVKVTVAAGQFCGYSSQLASGNGPGAVDFADRIAYIWTNTKAYLFGRPFGGARGRARLRRGEIDGYAAICCRKTLKVPVFDCWPL